MPKINILLCGGGTGGHYYPLMAIKKDLHLKSDFNFSYVGAKKGIENSKIENEKIEYKLITISGLNRKLNLKLILKNLKVIINIIVGFFSVTVFFIKQKPNLVISTGGYSSFLPLQVARMLRIPYILHEQNSYPGIVTKLFSKKAKAVFLGFKNAEKYASDPMPGYTHLQRAMPSTWGLWFSSFAESFLDNLDLLRNTKSWININPLGSAAGYGVNLPIKRDISTKELGFKRKQLNSLYVQNSRGKFELELIGALKQPMLDIRKFSWDMSLFLTQEFNLLSIASKYSTGSSIMPNKSNPDVIEIMRANYAVIAGHYSELENLISLPSGYQRDLQLTKRSLIHSIHCVLSTLELIPGLVSSIKINSERSNEFIDAGMLMTDRANELVQSGLPFREAYIKIKSDKSSKSIVKNFSRKNASVGSAYNLQLSNLKNRLKKL